MKCNVILMKYIDYYIYISKIDQNRSGLFKKKRKENLILGFAFKVVAKFGVINKFLKTFQDMPKYVYISNLT